MVTIYTLSNFFGSVELRKKEVTEQRQFENDLRSENPNRSKKSVVKIDGTPG